MAKQDLSKNSIRRVDGIMGHLQGIATLIGKIKEPAVRDLIRRAAIPIARDAFPANSMPEHTSGGFTSDPTGSTATAAMGEKPERPHVDQLSRDARSVERLLKRAEKDLLDAVGILEGQKRKLEKKKERPTTVPCSICLVVSAEVSGWCRPDYNDWYKHGQPDRLLWEMYKRRDVDENEVLRVPECPHPTGVAVRGPWKSTS